MGPYEVLERSDKYFTLQVGSRQDRVSIDRLKVAIVDSDGPVQVAQPPKRGRPPTKNNNSSSGVPSSSGPQDAQQPSPSHQCQMVPKSPAIRPTYAEITTRSGRATKAPYKYTF